MREAAPIAWAHIHEGRPPTFGHERATGAQRRGILYEHGIQLWLLRELPLTYLPSPWLRYRRKGEAPRWAQPDGLAINPWTGELLIVEIKYQHTFRAWEQLRQIYTPIVKALFPSPDWKEPKVLEICRWYEPCLVLPEVARLCRGLEDLDAGAYNVLLKEG